MPPVPGSLTTHMIVDGAAEASAWYATALGAEELSRITLPDGRLIHVELRIGPATFMLADPFPEHGAVAPPPDTELPVVFYLHSDDVDALWQRAVDAGATITRPLADAPWGERDGQLRDPFGYRWGLAQRIRDLSPDELADVVRAAFAGA
jgi:uncharacterized glyoxalase superfamily protein PhnB